MEMKATRGQGDRFAENPTAEQQQTGHHDTGERDQNHGKKSVLKKVKEKAKKLKDSTIGKKKHREGEGGPPHKGEVREHGLPLDYMEEEEEEYEGVEEEDEEGNLLGADPPPGKVTEKMGQSEPSGAIKPGIYKPPDPQLQGGSVMGLKDVVNWPMLGATEVFLPVGEQESRPLDEDAGAKRSEPALISPVRGSKEEVDVPEPGRRGASGRPFDEDPDAKRSEPAVVSPDVTEAADQKPVAMEDTDLGPVLKSIKDLKFSEDFPTGSHDQFAPEPPAEPETELSRSEVAGEAKPTSTLLTEKVALAKDAIASMVHPKRDDEGVSASKYVMEKLSPGEEDKALSEVIQDAIHATTKVGDRDDSQAGAKESGSEAAAGGNRKGVVEKVKEVAASLVGKDQPHDGGHQASDLGREVEGAEDKKLQESTI
ncbi:uncharacterized protein LOC116252465 [Nymphaea colorata]|nr:uncharacterized protein LOC116252465 [Nymphaea colorata]